MKIGSKKGFTLIELLIVIAIIGILAVALLPTILGAPAKGRDAARKANLDSLVTAIEAYNLDNGGYPYIATNCANALTGAKVGSTSGSAISIAKYVPGGQVPKDPNTGSPPKLKGCATAGSYVYYLLTASTAAQTGGQNYALQAVMEVPGDANGKDTDISATAPAASGDLAVALAGAQTTCPADPTATPPVLCAYTLIK